MRLALPIVLTLIAFAANSVLTRVAIAGGHADGMSFAVLRVFAGALMLAGLALGQRRPLRLFSRRRAIGAVTLSAYMIGFSLAYRTLDAGLGALILFGVVQITMFAVGALTGARPTGRALLGAAIAFAGLVVVLDPAGAGTAAFGALAMTVAGVGWGLYTLAGRGEPDALAGTAANFCLALPICALALLPGGGQMTVTGATLAILAGAVTSGLGYALWYAILPRIEPATAAVLQLSVPVLATLGGVLLLGETVGLGFLAGAVLVLGGIALSLPRRKA